MAQQVQRREAQGLEVGEEWRARVSVQAEPQLEDREPASTGLTSGKSAEEHRRARWRAQMGYSRPAEGLHGPKGGREE